MVPKLLTRQYNAPARVAHTHIYKYLSILRRPVLGSHPQNHSTLTGAGFIFVVWKCWDLHRKGPTELLFRRHIEDWPFAWCVCATRQVIEKLLVVSYFTSVHLGSTPCHAKLQSKLHTKNRRPRSNWRSASKREWLPLDLQSIMTLTHLEYMYLTNLKKDQKSCYIYNYYGY